MCPNITTHKDQEIDQAVRKYTKDLIDLRMGGMPQCRIVTNIRHEISPYKTFRDMLNDDAMNKIYIASTNKC